MIFVIGKVSSLFMGRTKDFVEGGGVGFEIGLDSRSECLEDWEVLVGKG